MAKRNTPGKSRKSYADDVLQEDYDAVNKGMAKILVPSGAIPAAKAAYNEALKFGSSAVSGAADSMWNVKSPKAGSSYSKPARPTGKSPRVTVTTKPEWDDALFKAAKFPQPKFTEGMVKSKNSKLGAIAAAAGALATPYMELGKAKKSINETQEKIVKRKRENRSLRGSKPFVV